MKRKFTHFLTRTRKETNIRKCFRSPIHIEFKKSRDCCGKKFEFLMQLRDDESFTNDQWRGCLLNFANGIERLSKSLIHPIR